LHNAYIGDLGFAKSVNNLLDTKSEGIYGMLPYIAPEVLRGKQFTKASDIYSFEMIMWEISSGYVVYPNRKNNDQDNSSLAIDICNGLRPTIPKGTPQFYIDLLKKCWDSDFKNDQLL
jgi:serine/threonine protein kinase